MSKPRPFPQSYWIESDMFCAGHYPGDQDPAMRRMKLESLANSGIRRTINLIPEHEKGRNDIPFEPYAPLLAEFSANRGSTIECLRFGFPDGGIPEISLMKTILDTIDASLAAKEPIYIHCWGGHGRTSTVVGCYLIRHGATPAEAIARILSWRSELPRNWFPYQNEQQSFVEMWRSGQ